MKKIIPIILTFNMLLFSSCWDMRELNEVGLVMAVGVDRVEGTDNFRVTAQMARPSSGEKGNGGVSGSEPVWTASAEGKTIFEAIRNLTKFTSRKVMWAHNNIVVIGESLAREDITPVVDFFTHNQELRMESWVAVSRGDAGKYIAAKTGMENIPGLSIGGVFRNSELSGESIRSDMRILLLSFLSDSRQPVLGGFRIKDRVIPTGGSQEHGGGDQVELAGAAVFKGRKMVGWLSPEESRGIGILLGEIKSAAVVVTMEDGEKKKVSVELTNLDKAIKTKIDEGKPTINIQVKGKGMIVEEDAPSDINVSIQELKDRVGELVEKELKEQMKLAVEKVQRDFKSDVIGFGRYIHIQNRSEWYGGIKANWGDIYPDIPVSYDVAIDIETSYLYQRPMRIEKVEGQ